MLRDEIIRGTTLIDKLIKYMLIQIGGVPKGPLTPLDTNIIHYIKKVPWL